jgi:hypothetical protein
MENDRGQITKGQKRKIDENDQDNLITMRPGLGCTIGYTLRWRGIAKGGRSVAYTRLFTERLE